MEMMMGISLTLLRQTRSIAAQVMNLMSLISVTGLKFLMVFDPACCHTYNVLEFLFKQSEVHKRQHSVCTIFRIAVIAVTK